MEKLEHRAARAERIVREAGKLALSFFHSPDALRVERKGHQDFVSQADREVEMFIRDALDAAFPDDGIVGEEHDRVSGTTGWTWVIDPIDGTTNFVTQIPAWTVVLAGVAEGRTQIGVIYDACHDEMFVATRGMGARLNGRALVVEGDKGLREGSVGTGFSNRVPTDGVARLVTAVLAEGGVFHRNASGALSLAYVAAGRLLGYAEEHMNAWDCLAGQLLVEEAGGRVEDQDADAMIETGGRVIVGAPGAWDDLLRISEAAFAAG